MIDTKVEGIGHLLSDRLLAVPDYQRSYSWDDEEVKELWRDIEEAIASGAPEYFLGSLVTTGPGADGRLRVIDGQQRLATVSLLFAAVRDVFGARADERVADIEREVLGKRNIVSRVIEQRLVLNADDNDLFRQLTLVPAADRVLNVVLDSHERLAGAFAVLERKVAELVDGLGADAWQAPLLRLYSYILDNARVIEVTVPDEGRAFVIFETLNDRGLNLSTADLLKNHLFGSSGARLDETKIRWGRAMGAISAGSADLATDTFLRHLWASKKGVVRIKALYSQIKPEITDADSAVSFADELAEAAPLWTAMFDRDADMWREFGAETQAALDALRNLQVEQCRPLLLAALRRFNATDLQRLLSLVVAWSVRWSVVGGGGAGVVERLYAQAAQKVTDREFTTVDEVVAYFDAAVPADLAFEEAFRIARVRRGWLARYYLTVLERAARGDAEPELVPNENVDEVNLEHVLPKNPSAGWLSEFTPEEAENMVLLLGNQCLLRKSHNRNIGNQPFSVKKPILEASDLRLTNEVGLLDEWTPDAIRERQARLAAQASQVWRKA